MTEREKQLLFKDLCARAMYRPFVQLNLGAYNRPAICILTGVDCPDRVYISTVSDYYNIENVKPYLRPMSSMTEEEKEELRQEHCKDEKLYAECLTKATQGDDSMRGKVIIHFAADWCNKNHFDYRGLIEMELALEAKEGMYKTE